MVDFSVFDSILDIVFVIDGDGKIMYCNEMAATFCSTSVRRVSGKVMLTDVITFAEPGLFPFTENSQGRHAPTPFIETAFEVAKANKKGKVQLALRPMGDGAHWGLFIKDVSLEETLAAKYRAELAKTEAYARNLEILVAERTAELANLNQTLNAILNSLGQGFFTFNAAGECGRVFTKACEDVLEGAPSGRKAWEVLNVPASEVQQFQMWSESIFKELLPFEDLKTLGPGIFPHTHAKHIVLDYFPIRLQRDSIGEVVVVATDKTTEYQAQQDLEAERHYAAMIVKYMKNKDQFLQFLASVKQSFANLKMVALKPLAAAAVHESFRVLHTLEGEAGTFSLNELRLLSRASQQILEPFKAGEPMDQQAHAQYRMSLEEMENRFAIFLDENKETFKIPEGHVSRLVELPVDSINGFLDELRSTGTPKLVQRYQEIFLTAAIEDRLKYFDGLVQNVASRLGKRVKPIAIEGGSTRIFPEPYQQFFSSLVHAFRNAVDHGLEMPEEREWAGKNPMGELRVKVMADKSHLWLSLSDDGKGIDPAVIREKLKGKFPDRDFTGQTDEEIIQNVCLPGFSSREEVGEFSGRGVGLDALREEVLKLGGTVHLKSKVGQGTTIEIALPMLGFEIPALRSA